MLLFSYFLWHQDISLWAGFSFTTQVSSYEAQRSQQSWNEVNDLSLLRD